MSANITKIAKVTRIFHAVAKTLITNIATIANVTIFWKTCAITLSQISSRKFY